MLITKKDYFAVTKCKPYNDKVRILEQFFNLSQDMLCVIGLDGYFKKVSVAFAELLGYTVKELLLNPYSWYIVEKNSSKTKYEKNFPYYFENGYKSKDGNTKWFSWQSSKPSDDNLIYLIAKDISDLKKAEFEANQYSKQLEIFKKENLESLRYAQRLQNIIMPDRESLQYLFPQSFISFLPKQGVSGDFFWFDNSADRNIIVLGDCTGHGVPGALLSVLGVNILNNALHHENLSTPEELIKKLDHSINKLLCHKFTGEKVDDGMDVCICAVDKNKLTMEYIAINNSIYIVRRNELIELEAQKYLIGSNKKDENLKSDIFQLEHGDKVYLLSDGFADQFGGPSGKKFGYPRLRKLLCENTHLTMQEQQLFIEQTMYNWMGNLEQIDDISCLGFKI